MPALLDPSLEVLAKMEQGEEGAEARGLAHVVWKEEPVGGEGEQVRQRFVGFDLCVGCGGGGGGGGGAV